ncbi:MAG: hypothetical protein ACI9KE_001657 [Polyangiales bacterium]|jgi:hypothetical protein
MPPDFLADTLARLPQSTIDACPFVETPRFRPGTPIHVASTSTAAEIRDVCHGVKASCEQVCIALVSAEVARRLYFQVAWDVQRAVGKSDQDPECGEKIARAPDAVADEVAHEIGECLRGPLPDRVSVEMTLVDTTFDNSDGVAMPIRRIQDLRIRGSFVPVAEGVRPSTEVVLQLEE